MDQPRVSVSIITRDRTDELAVVLESLARQEYLGLEVIIGDNGSEAGNLEVIRSICSRFPQVTLHEFGQNLGVSGGRNAVLERCRGDIIIEVDDDAIVPDSAAFSRVVATFQQHPKVGIVAFKITNFHTRKTDRIEYPFLQKSRDVDLPGEAAWFIGCGHAFRREIIEEVGLYHDFAPYGAEELDYAFRALDHGWTILYEPTIEVLHKKSLKHRIVDPVQWGTMSLKQRMKVALLNLPAPMCATYFLVRVIRYTRGFRHPSVIWRALQALWAERAYIRANRKCIRFATVKHLIRLRGPIFF